MSINNHKKTNQKNTVLSSLEREELLKNLEKTTAHKDSEYFKSIVENETKRISGVVDATSEQKEKIKVIVFDLCDAYKKTPPEKTIEFSEIIENRFREILSEDQQKKLGLK